MRKRNIAALVGLLCVVAVGGTWAYFHQVLEAVNVMDTAKYGSTLVEEFTPEDDWQPGAEVNKDVYVTNTGDVPVVARVRFTEEWYRGEYQPENVFKSNDPVTTVITSEDEVKQADPTDGKVPKDETEGSVVVKTLASSSNWVYNEADGWYYYKDKIQGGEKTDKLLDSIRLSSNTDFGGFEIKYYYTSVTDARILPEAIKAEDGTVLVPAGTVVIGEKPLDMTDNPQTGWAVNEIGPVVPKEATFSKADTELKKEDDVELKGYSDAGYRLKVTAQTCQATDKVVAEYFKHDPDDPDKEPYTIPADILEGWQLKSEDASSTNSAEP